MTKLGSRRYLVPGDGNATWSGHRLGEQAGGEEIQRWYEDWRTLIAKGG